MSMLYVSPTSLMSAMRFEALDLMGDWGVFRKALDDRLKSANSKLKVKDEEAKNIFMACSLSFNMELFRLSQTDKDIADYVSSQLETQLLLSDVNTWEKYEMFRLAFYDGLYNRSDVYNFFASQSNVLFYYLTNQDIHKAIKDKTSGGLFFLDIIGGISVQDLINMTGIPWAALQNKITVAITNETAKRVKDDDLNKLAELIAKARIDAEQKKEK